MKLYEEFKYFYRNSKICLPKAPSLVKVQSKKQLTPSEVECKKGYYSGWKHGMGWSKVAIRDGETRESGAEKLKCLLSVLEPG